MANMAAFPDPVMTGREESRRPANATAVSTSSCQAEGTHHRIVGATLNADTDVDALADTYNNNNKEKTSR